MARTDAIILAVVIPLLACLLILAAVLILRSRRHRLQQLHRVTDECAQLREQLANYPKAWSTRDYECGYQPDDIKRSFGRFTSLLMNYTRTWMELSIPSVPESPARIEAILFPAVSQPYPETPAEDRLDEIAPGHLLTAGKDIRTFPNPHQYTPSDICALLDQKVTRISIAEHIISSILLKVVALDGNPLETLLPIKAQDLYALHKTRSLIEGVERKVARLLCQTES